MDFTSPPVPLQIVLAAVVLVAATTDLRSRRIPNWLTLFGVGSGILLNCLLNLDKYNWRSTLLGLGLALLVYFPMYLLRGMGAGDVKLMAAVGALAGPSNWFVIFILTNVLGGAAALILLASKKGLFKTLRNVGYLVNELVHLRPPYLKKEELDLNSPKAVTMPHGLAVAFGSLFFLAAPWI